MAYKYEKWEIEEMVNQFANQIKETASKIGTESAFGFLYGQDHMIIGPETIVQECEQFAATMKKYVIQGDETK